MSPPSSAWRAGHNSCGTASRVAGAHVCRATFGQVLEQVDPLVGRGISASLITPSTDPEWIKGLSTLLRRGIHCTALLLDAPSFNGQGPNAANTQGVLGALADLGVSGHIIRKGFRFELLTQRRQQRPEYKVLGTGRVIVTKAGNPDEAEWMPVGQGDS